MNVRHLIGVLGALLVTAAGLAATGGAGISDAAAKCGDPKTEPLGSIYGNNRGSTGCNDGASAKATLGGKTYSFTGGVCWRETKSGGFYVQIGTTFPGSRDRRTNDPSGFGVFDTSPGGFLKDRVYFGLTKAKKVISWSNSEDMKLKVSRGSAPKGTFSGVETRLVNGKLTKIPASGSFSCERVLKVPI